MDRKRIISFVEGAGIIHKISGDELQVCCPFCPDGDVKFKFYFNLKKEQGHCFRCDTRIGTTERFLKQVCKIPLSSITATEKSRVVDNYLSHIIKCRKQPDLRIPAEFPAKTIQVMTHPSSILCQEVYNYLWGRGFTQETIKLLDPQVSFTYPNWFILPVYNFGELRFWVRRSLQRYEEPKYLSFSYKADGDGDEDKYYGSGDVLWGLDLIKQGEPLILCEGILSAASVIQQGLSAVALLGSTMSKAQRVLLQSKEPSQIVVALDGKRPGDNTLKKTAHITKMLHDRFERVDFITLPDGKDPNDLGSQFKTYCEEETCLRKS
jgi:hypothetical protein